MMLRIASHSVLKHDPEKPAFRTDHAQIVGVERDGASKKSHRALAVSSEVGTGSRVKNASSKDVTGRYHHARREAATGRDGQGCYFGEKDE
jgi:hypothetical protein